MVDYDHSFFSVIRMDAPLTFEELYERFILRKYGPNFFKYTLYLNMILILFITSLVMVYYSETKMK